MKDIKNDILRIIQSITEIEISELTEKTPLLGDSAILDSMSLVELCVNLEDYANENGFKFDWTSNSTMSNTRSMFRNIGTLLEEFSSQNNDKS
jgi:acyl carrier protein